MRRRTISSLSSVPPRNRPLCRALSTKKRQTPPWVTKMRKPTHRMKRVTALAIVQRPPAHGQSIMICWKKTERAAVAMPPQGVDPQNDSSPSHSSESPIKRRPGTKASAGRGQPKKLRPSAGQASKPPLGSIPEHGQQTVTADQMQESPVSRDPATPSEHPEEAQKCPQAMTEIDLDNDQRNVERGGTAATDIQLEAEQRAMQALHVHQAAFHAGADADTKGMALPSLQLYSDLPREWPMARLCISNKQVNRLVRTFLWRRVAESALHGTSFENIPEEINPDYIADLHRISEAAFAAPLANLFAFAKQGHKLCSFIPQKQLALYANPLFWKYRPLRLCLQALLPQ